MTILRTHLYRTATLVAESQQLTLRDAVGRLSRRCRELGLTREQLTSLTEVVRDMDREIEDVLSVFYLGASAPDDVPMARLIAVRALSAKWRKETDEPVEDGTAAFAVCADELAEVIGSAERIK